MSDRQREYRRRLKELNLCIQCARNSPKPGRTKCHECAPFSTRVHRSTRDRGIRRRYPGLDERDYEQMVIAQGGRCKSCGDIPQKPLVIDHCHTTGKVRGLLCDPCNKGEGFFFGSVERLQAMIRYLQANRN